MSQRTDTPPFDDEIVHGTVHLVDIQGILNYKKDENSKHNIILQPQPTSNPNDPLRWTKARKRLQFYLLFFWAFMQALSLNWSGPIFLLWTQEWNCTFMNLNIASAISFIFLALGCTVLQPTALKLGKRLVYIIGTIVAIVSAIIGSQTHSVQLFYVVKLLSGFSASPVDSLVEISTTDLFFQHERAQYIGWFVFSIYAGSDLGPVACGYIVERYSWRWCFYILIIIFFCILVVQLFVMEDTTFRRPDDHLEEGILNQIKSHVTMLSGDNGEVPSTETKHNIDHEVSSKENLSDLEEANSESVKMRTYWQRMRLYDTEYNDPRPWLTICLRPYLLITFPAVIWAGIVYGSQIMWLTYMGTTQSEFFSAPPYNFPPQSVGLTNVAAFLGSAFGMVYGGKFVDMVAIKLAERNNGILEPEFRLWTLFIPVAFNAAGIIAYGLGAYYGAHWFVPAGLGQFLLGFSMAASGTVCITYAVECYPKLASEAIVLMLVIRNLIGCGFTFAIQPWLHRDGLKLTTWLLFMLTIVINGSFIFFIKYGKPLRRWTTQRYLRYSEGELAW